MAATLAHLEGLDAHAAAVERRLAVLEQRLVNAPAPSPTSIARPDILGVDPYEHAAWDPALERLHANELPWRSSD